MRVQVILGCLLLFASPALAMPEIPHYDKDDHSILVLAKDQYEQVHHDGRTFPEPVCFDWTNTDVAWHTLPDPEPWRILDADGVTVHSLGSPDVEVDVPPGYSHARCWLQTDTEGAFAPSGDYTLVFKYDRHELRLDFTLRTTSVSHL